MTNDTRYGAGSNKPIRKDRLLIAGLILLAAILIPVLLTTQHKPAADKPLAVSSEGQPVGTAPTTPSTTGSTTKSVDDVVNEILPGGSASSSGSSTTGSSTKPTTSSTSGSSSPATTPASSTAPSSASSTNSSILSHIIKQGETLQGIANAMGVTVAILRASNHIYGTDAPAVGRVVYGAKNGIVHTIEPGQRLNDIAATYGVTAAAIQKANGIADPSKIFAGSRLFIPGASTTLWDTVTTLSKGKASRFIWPLQGNVVSGFGWRVHPVLGQRMEHTGIDIDVPEGTTVYASASGVVYFYGEQSGYGSVLILEHDGGFYTMYGHLKSSFVRAGQYVEQGQKIAVSGNTGISSGPHLHFELRQGEFPIDPLSGTPPFLP